MKQVVMTEVQTPDGGVGVQLDGGTVHRGYDLADVRRVVEALFMGDIDLAGLPSYGDPLDLDANAR